MHNNFTIHETIYIEKLVPQPRVDHDSCAVFLDDNVIVICAGFEVKFVLKARTPAP